jgi:hypothetical protein
MFGWDGRAVKAATKNASAADEKSAVDEKSPGNGWKRRLDIEELNDCEHLRCRIEGTKALQKCSKGYNSRGLTIHAQIAHLPREGCASDDCSGNM